MSSSTRVALGAVIVFVLLVLGLSWVATRVDGVEERAAREREETEAHRDEGQRRYEVLRDSFDEYIAEATAQQAEQAIALEVANERLEALGVPRVDPGSTVPGPGVSIVRSPGQDGKDGQDGQDGADGEDGEDGLDGEDGADGLNGLDGAHGLNGMSPACLFEASACQGAKGDKGDPGEKGDKGDKGDPGEPGEMPPEFSIDYGGILYLCTDDPTTEQADYQCAPAPAEPPPDLPGL